MRPDGGVLFEHLFTRCIRFFGLFTEFTEFINGHSSSLHKEHL